MERVGKEKERKQESENKVKTQLESINQSSILRIAMQQLIAVWYIVFENRRMQWEFT